MKSQKRITAQRIELPQADSEQISLRDIHLPQGERRLPPLQSDEIAISGRGISRHFIGHPNNLRRQLQGHILVDPRTAALHQVERTIGVEIFTLSRRQAGSRIVWTLPLADKSRLGKVMGWEEKIELGQLQENEIAVSGPGLLSHFIGIADRLRKQLKGQILWDPKKTARQQVACTIGGEIFTFSRRQNGPAIVWALPLADRSRLGRAVGWEEKIELGPLPENEIAVSGPGLSPYFIGIAAKLKNQLQGHILLDPLKSARQQVECTIGGEIFMFSRRQAGSRIVWALPLADRSHLAKAMGWEEKIELCRLKENEIAISKYGISPHFTGNAHNLTKQLKGHILVDPKKTARHQVECTIGGEIFTFSRRQSGTIIIWALPLADKPRLAKAMNWEIREEKERSTGIAALATFLSAVETHNAASSKQPGSSTQK